MHTSLCLPSSCAGSNLVPLYLPLVVADGLGKVPQRPEPLAKAMKPGVQANMDDQILRRQHSGLDSGDDGWSCSLPTTGNFAWITYMLDCPMNLNSRMGRFREGREVMQARVRFAPCLDVTDLDFASIPELDQSCRRLWQITRFDQQINVSHLPAGTGLIYQVSQMRAFEHDHQDALLLEAFEHVPQILVEQRIPQAIHEKRLAQKGKHGVGNFRGCCHGREAFVKQRTHAMFGRGCHHPIPVRHRKFGKLGFACGVRRAAKTIKQPLVTRGCVRHTFA